MTDSQNPEYEARRFTEFLHARFTKAAPHGIVMGKLPRKEFVASLGVKVPETYKIFSSPDSIDFSELPSRFVLKPVNLFSSYGVYLLERRGENFFELMQQQPISPADVVSDLKRIFAKLGTFETSILAEELVTGENGYGQIPFDYKFWMFGETTGAILQTNRNTKPSQLACFGPEFEPLPEGSVLIGEKRRPGVPVIPANAAAICEAAKMISLRLDTPFCGVDFYTSGRDVLFGELTPTPGGPYYGGLFRLSKSFDEKLGAYWRAGCLKRGQPIPKISSPPPIISIEQSEGLGKSV